MLKFPCIISQFSQNSGIGIRFDTVDGSFEIRLTSTTPEIFLNPCKYWWIFTTSTWKKKGCRPFSTLSDGKLTPFFVTEPKFGSPLARRCWYLPQLVRWISEASPIIIFQPESLKCFCRPWDSNHHDKTMGGKNGKPPLLNPKGFNHPNWVNHYFNGGGSPG